MNAYKTFCRQLGGVRVSVAGMLSYQRIKKRKIIIIIIKEAKTRL
jgi:hypothetical protein